MSQSWLWWALLSTFCYGMHAFLFKKLIQDKGDVPLAQIVIPTVVALFAVLAIYMTDSYIAEKTAYLFVFAVLQGILFFFTTESRFLALQTGAPSNVVFPIIKSGTVLVILLSALIFNEWDKLLQPFPLAGVVLSIGVMFLLIDFEQDNKNKKISSDGLRFVLFATVSSVGATLAPKYAIHSQNEINILLFILVSNLTNLILARLKHLDYKLPVDRQASIRTVYIASIMGALSFVGFAAFLKAITLGSLSIVAAVSSLYIVIPVVLSAVLYGESFKLRAQLAVLLSIVAMILISLGKI